jgi:hypothetical protein
MNSGFKNNPNPFLPMIRPLLYQKERIYILNRLVLAKKWVRIILKTKVHSVCIRANFKSDITNGSVRIFQFPRLSKWEHF